MMRSMFSGVSGLRAHQVKMDTIGNNIANVNTVGFKSSKVSFQEVFSQTVKGAGSPTSAMGGTNPQSIGLGTSIGSVDVIHSKGSSQRTDNPTDLMVDGNGFFVLTNDADAQNKFYTRAGNFTVDRDGFLVSNNGFKVLGTNMKPVQINKSQMNPAQATSSFAITGNININDPTYTTTVDVYDSLGRPNTLSVNFGAAIQGVPAPAPPYANDPKKTANPLTGALATKSYTFREVSFSDMSKTVTVPPTAGTDKVYAIFNDQGDFVDVAKLDAAAQSALKPAVTVPATLPVAPTTLTAPGTLSFTPSGALPFNFVIDRSLFFEGNDTTKASLSQYSKATDLKGQPGPGTAANGTKGAAAGSINSFNIAAGGDVVAVFTNGEKQTVATIGLADFDNTAGLMKVGNNMFTDTSNSGSPKFGKPATGSYGALAPGALEMSNVDLAAEFTDMITTQRGFQANSKIITTSDEILQELVNLKR